MHQRHSSLKVVDMEEEDIRRDDGNPFVSPTHVSMTVTVSPQDEELRTATPILHGSPREDSTNQMVHALELDREAFPLMEDNTFLQHVSSSREFALKCCRTVFFMGVITSVGCTGVGYALFEFVLRPYYINKKGKWSNLPMTDKAIIKGLGGISAPLGALFMWLITRSLVKYSKKHRHQSTVLSLVLGTTHTALQFADPYMGDLLSRTNIGLLLFIFVICGNFFITHLHLKGLPGARGIHMAFCAISMLAEAANGVCIRLLPSMYKSDWFPWVSPFVFCLSSLLTRKAAEISVVRISSASKISTISTVLSVLLQRLAQSSVMESPLEVFRLEAFFVFFQLLLRVTLYYRHGFISKLMSGLFVLKPVRNPRSQRVTSRSILSEAIFDTSFFTTFFVLRYSVQGTSVVHPAYFALMVVVCVIMQIVGVYLTVITISFFERVPIQEIDLPSQTFAAWLGHIPHYIISILFGFCYFATFVPQFWFDGAWDSIPP